MKTPLVSLLAAGCMAVALTAAEPDATPAPSPVNIHASSLNYANGVNAPGAAVTPAPGASPSASPVRHRHHHVVAASPTPSATPKKHPWWEGTAKVAKATPSPAPSATPRKMKHAVPAKPETAATPAPSASPSATPVPRPTAEPSASPKPSASPEATPKKLRVRQASPSPSATPKKEPQGSLWGIFKHHEKKPKASPSPSASPAHKHRAKTAASPSPGEAPVVESNAGATPAPSAPAAPEATPESTPKQPASGMTSQVPFVPPVEKQPEAPIVETKTPAEEEAEETAHFEAAKTKALQDQHIQELQSKADAATGDAARLAMRRYYKALYEKMRNIDPSLSDRIDRTEEATMRRVEQENTQ